MKMRKLISTALILCAAAAICLAAQKPSAAGAKTPVVSPVTGEARCEPAPPAGVAGPRKNYTAWGEHFRAVLSGDTLELSGDGIRDCRLHVKRVKVKNGVDFNGKIAGLPVKLSLRRQSCRDLQGRSHDLSSRLRYGKRIFRGCAVPGAFEIADT